jgi:hypothetical protein
MNTKEKPVESRQKRLVMDIPCTLHRQIKEWALYRNTTIKQYVLEAIIERFKKDLQFK